MKVMLVYGTLRPGIVENVARIKGRMYDMGGYPGVELLGPGAKDEILVERCEVEDRRIPNLDNYEGYDDKNPNRSLFIKQEIDDPFIPGQKASIYVFNFRGVDPSNFDRIASGDWLEHRGHKSGTAASMMGIQFPFDRKIGHNSIQYHSADPLTDEFGVVLDGVSDEVTDEVQDDLVEEGAY